MSSHKALKYRKVYPQIWNDEKFMRLTTNAKFIFLFLLTHPNMTALGAMRGNIPGMAYDLGWTTKDFEEAFGEVLREGMARYDPKASFVWLPNFLKYNRPESPNVVISWIGSVSMLPECDLKIAMFEKMFALSDSLTPTFAEAFRKAFGQGCRHPIANQEPEPEPEPEPEKEKEPELEPNTCTSKSGPSTGDRVGEIPEIISPNKSRAELSDDEIIPEEIPGETASLFPDDDNIAFPPTSNANAIPPETPNEPPPVLKAGPVPYEEIKDAFHAHCPSLPKIRKVDEDRKKEIQKVWKWIREDSDSETNPLDAVILVFKKIEADDFSCGRTDRGTWRADFDYIFRLKIFRRFYEKNDAPKSAPFVPGKAQMNRAHAVGEYSKAPNTVFPQFQGFERKNS